MCTCCATEFFFRFFCHEKLKTMQTDMRVVHSESGLHIMFNLFTMRRQAQTFNFKLQRLQQEWKLTQTYTGAMSKSIYFGSCLRRQCSRTLHKDHIVTSLRFLCSLRHTEYLTLPNIFQKPHMWSVGRGASGSVRRSAGSKIKSFCNDEIYMFAADIAGFNRAV